jgi:DNA-binding response OmpR family regulator
MGYSVESVHTGPEGVDQAISGDYRAIILDVMLPGMDGFEVLKHIRQQSSVPVLMLTARGDEMDRIVGLEIGADDYLPKTFSTRELLARLRAVIRRSQSSPETNQESGESEIVIGPIRINSGARLAWLSDQALTLTPVEFDLLHSLAQAKGRVKSREQLLDEIAQRDYEIFDRSINVHISALRKKLNDDPKHPIFIKTVRSAGYMMLRPS